MNDIQISKNFKLSEFQCKDSSQLVKIDEKLLALLQIMRDKLGKPMTIHSGYRTPEYNKKVGGSPNSQHLKGTACDFSVKGMTPKQLAVIAEQVGFDGIGVYKTFIHCDCRGYKARWSE
jgi:uncharacterized protein YcbK (DUF882 family)